MKESKVLHVLQQAFPDYNEEWSAIVARQINHLYQPSDKHCRLYKKLCIGEFCSVTPSPESCEHLQPTKMSAGEVLDIISDVEDKIKIDESYGQPYESGWVDACGMIKDRVMHLSELSDKMNVNEWYAKETNREVSEFDAYDLHICNVAKRYINYLNQQP